MRKTENNSLEIMRHSLSHILASAVKRLYPAVKLGIGPAIENGFYYDFDFTDADKRESQRERTPISKDDLSVIEKEMQKIIKENASFEKHELSIVDAKEKLKDEPYKIDLINELEAKGEKKVSFYTLGEFADLCIGPHVADTKEVGVFKLDKTAGAYWRGDEKNKMLTRIYGVAFASKDDLMDYLKMMEEAKKRDHRKLGKELDLFSLHEEVPGMIFWHPKGMVLWNELEKFGKSLRKKSGGQEIKTPQMAKNGLWITSGHWDHYKDDMFVFDVDKETYCLKPMDCPFNILIYKSKPHSYKDLPVRFTEIGRVFRNEKSGELNGLFRVREITQDDSHIFLRPDQVEEEIASQLRMVKEYYATFGIKPEFFLSTRPEDFMGEIKTWDIAEKNLRDALQKEGLQDYGIKDKDGAFYGPKIDVNIRDVFGRAWQVATIQLDFQLAGRFNLEYIDAKSQKQTPVMIHAAIFGSFERFIGVLIEHYGGIFPVWLSPVQVKILPVSEKFNEYAADIAEKFKIQGIRVEVDNRNESLGKKIREGEKEKVPYLLIVGEKEAAENKVAVRKHGKGDEGVIGSDAFADKIKKKISERV